MLGRVFDSAGKRAVRELWNTPFLDYLNRTHGLRYRYLGLPGVDLLDVMRWKDMIDEVIAFEVPAAPRKDDPEGRRFINALRRNLRLLGIPGHAYFGPIEEVVILRKDYDGGDYGQERVVTLYNLDFCDEIGSRIATRGQGRQVWRFEAIRQILRDQREVYRRLDGPSLFVILLTVRDQIDSQKLAGFLRTGLYGDTQAFIGTCASLNPLPSTGYVLGTHSWALKAFLHNTIRQYLTNPHISALFFPPVKYSGTPVKTKNGQMPSPMLHYMILCRFDDPQNPTPLFLPNDYLASTSSARARDDQVLMWEAEPGEPATPHGDPDSTQWFQPWEQALMGQHITTGS